MLQAGGPLGDDEHGDGIGKGPQGFSQGRVRGIIQGAGAVVQDQNLRLLHQSSGDGQPLPLAAGQIPSPLLHRVIQALAFGPDKILRLCQPQRLPQLLLRGIRISPQKIGTDSSGKQLSLLHDYAHHIPETFPVPLTDGTPHQGNRPRGGVIEPGNQIHKTGFSASGTADDSDGLALPGGKGNVRETLRAGPGIGEPHMIEPDGLLSGILPGSLLCCLWKFHGRLRVQHLLHPSQACQRPADADNQIGQLYQLHQDLIHIIDQRHNSSGQQNTALHLPGARIQDGDHSQVHRHIGERIHQSGNMAHMKLQIHQRIIGRRKLLHLGLLPAEGPDHPDAGEIFPGGPGNRVQTGLNLFVPGGCPAHDAEHNHRQHRDRHHKNQRHLHIDGKGHDHGAEHDKGRTQEQAQHHVHSVLHLIGVAGHPGDQR